MKQRIWLALTVVIAATAILAIGPKTQAWMQFRSGNDATVARGETIDNTLWVGARNIDIAGTVNGDLFCGGQTVNISGLVKGDVICGAQNLTISGKVEGSVRLAAQTINLYGHIGRNASVAGQSIITDSNNQIRADASFAASDMNLGGDIGRDLVVAGDTITLSGEVGRDIKGTINKMTLISGAKVGGGIDYTSQNKIDITSGSTVSGVLTQHQPQPKEHPFFRLLFFGGLAALLVGLVLLLSAVVITALVPRLVHNVSTQAIRRPWKVLLTGFIASLVIPVLAVLLMLTVVGIPLGILLLLGWLLVGLTSGLFAAYYTGRRIWSTQNNPLLRVLLGGVILLILSMIPFLGFFVMLVAFWLGAGMVLAELKSRTPSPKYQLK